MNRNLSKYEVLINGFLDGSISIEEFQSTFFREFQNEESMDERSYEILNELFGDVDSYTTDKVLLVKDPGFYLDEDQLRSKAQLLCGRLISH